MKNHVRIVCLVFILLCMAISAATAEVKEFIRDYTYQAGEDDSKRSSRIRAVAEVKRALLEELGTYVESRTEVQNYMLTKDEITSISAGITQLTVLEEKWDGEIFYIKALIKADGDDVEKRIKILVQERSKIKELEDTMKREQRALEQSKKLQEELKQVKEENERLKLQKEYMVQIDSLSAEDFLQKGNTAYYLEHWQEALDLYLQAVKLQPGHFGAYYSAGLAQSRLGNYDAALRYYQRSLELKPDYSDTYYNIGNIWFYKGNYDKALEYYGKTIEMSPKDASAWYNAGSMYVWKNDFKKAVPYLKKSIELNPLHHAAFYNLGLCYGNLGYEQEGVKMIKEAARLGNDKAQELMKEWGETW